MMKWLQKIIQEFKNNISDSTQKDKPKSSPKKAPTPPTKSVKLTGRNKIILSESDDFFVHHFYLTREKDEEVACRKFYYGHDSFSTLQPRYFSINDNGTDFEVFANEYFLGTIPHVNYEIIKQHYNEIRRIAVNIIHNEDAPPEEDYMPLISMQFYYDDWLKRNPQYHFIPHGDRVPSYKRPSSLDEYIVLDIETTGLDPDRDEIIEVAALHILHGKIIDQFSELVYSEKVTPEILSLSQDAIQLQDIKKARKVQDVLADLAVFIGKLPVVGHNICFDLDFINVIHPLNNLFEDTCGLTRKFVYYSEKSTIKIKDCKLSTVCTAFGIEQPTAHRALNDCIATFQCYEKLKEFLRDVHNIDYPLRPEYIKQTIVPAVNKNPNLEGKIFTPSYDLKLLSFEYIARKVIANGGTINSNLTKKTEFYVYGDANNTTLGQIKRWQTQKVPIKCITEEQFLRMLESNDVIDID